MPKILLVEDEIIISEPFSLILRMQKYDLDIAGNGLEALEFCSKNSYDLILLDIMMPICSGVEFLKHADLTKTAPKTKVIMMTNLSSGKEIDEALSLGAKQSILKASVTPQKLIDLVKDELEA